MVGLATHDAIFVSSSASKRSTTSASSTIIAFDVAVSTKFVASTRIVAATHHTPQQQRMPKARVTGQVEQLYLVGLKLRTNLIPSISDCALFVPGKNQTCWRVCLSALPGVSSFVPWPQDAQPEKARKYSQAVSLSTHRDFDNIEVKSLGFPASLVDKFDESEPTLPHKVNHVGTWQLIISAPSGLESSSK
jgi:hypothetical protein